MSGTAAEWDVGCHESKIEDLEMNAQQRIMRDAKLFNEDINPEEIKLIVLQIMRGSVRFFEFDTRLGLPKYSIISRFPGTQNITIELILVQNERERTRKLLHIHTSFDNFAHDWNIRL